MARQDDLKRSPLFQNVPQEALLEASQVTTERHFRAGQVILEQDAEGEALHLINSHEFGNGAALFTRDGDTARNFAEKVQAGMVGINVPIPVPVGYHSFGGWKRSIFGSHCIYGPEAVHFYTKLKTITSRWPSGTRSGAQLNFPSN